jgi:hypothetical protein
VSARTQSVLPFDPIQPAPPGVLEARACTRALAMLGRWQAWPGGTLCLTGDDPDTLEQLAANWREMAGAGVWNGSPLASGAVHVRGPGAGAGAVDVSGPAMAEALYGLLSAAEAGQVRVLVTALAAPRAWPAAVSDLRSRLLAVPVEALPEPDADFLADLLLAHADHLRLSLSPASARWLALRLPFETACARQAAIALSDVTGLSRTLTHRNLEQALALVATPDCPVDPDGSTGPDLPDGTADTTT